ncbi:MAG: hypothetical protein JW837_18160 [Sedimentisphaerales bacterium]|nr:hypothetical protein [Sedimentisphaerales bacterium]
MQIPLRGQVLNKNHDLAGGLQGLWIPNNLTGEILPDLSGGNNQGLKITATFPAWKGGYRHGPVLDFNEHRLNGSKPTPLTSNCSILVWASHNAGSSTSYVCPFNHWNGGTSSLMSVHFVWTGAFHWWCGGSGGNNSPSYVYTDDTLHCLVVTRNAAGVGKLYVDGELIQTVTGKSWGSTSTPVHTWGKYIGNDGYPFYGQIGPTAVWDKRTLSPADIKRLFRQPYTLIETKSRPFFFVEAGGILNGSGAINTSFSAAGSAKVTEKGTGSINATTSASGSAKVTQKASGTINISASVSGAGTIAGGIITGSGTIAAAFAVTGSAKVIRKGTGTSNAGFSITGTAKVTQKASGSISISVSVSGAGTSGPAGVVFGSGTIAVNFVVTGVAGIGITEMPPELHAALIDPYSGGAWLWLVEIKLPGYSVIRYARNTEDVTLAEVCYTKYNFNIGLAQQAGDGSIPRISLQIPHDSDHTLEDIINTARGGAGGTVKIIRAHEDFLDKFITELEEILSILTGGSDSTDVILTLGIPDPLLRKIPVRRDSSKMCPYAIPSLFKGPECQDTSGDTTCGGKYEDCFDKGNQVHWGGELGLDPSITRI